MKGKHGHGGAWKVAYADFVTGMMALFIVLWLTSQDAKIREAVERAFKRSGISITPEGGGMVPGGGNGTSHIQTPPTSVLARLGTTSVLEMEMLRRLSEDIIRAFQSDAEGGENSSVQMQLTNEGLHISVFDRARKPVFKRDGAALTAYGEWLFSTLAWKVAHDSTLPLEIGGHTESGRPPVGKDYGPWELSSDRANTARRMLITHGVPYAQVRRVTGFADTLPVPGRPPEDEGNSRVTILLRLKSNADTASNKS